MKKLLAKLDPKYLKICTYAAVTVIITVVILFILSTSGGFWKTLWSLFTAVLTPIIIGGIICYLFLPIVSRLEKLLSKEPKKWTRPVAVLIFYTALAALILVALITIFYALKGSIENISLKSIQDLMTSLYEHYEGVILSLQNELSKSSLPIGELSNLLTALINGIASILSNLMFGVIFSIYFMIDEKGVRGYWGRAIRLINGPKVSSIMASFTKEADRVFSGYIRGQFTDAVIVAIITSVIFSIAGIPYGTVIGILVGIGNLIPYVGPVVGYGSIFVVCLVTGDFDKMILGIFLMIIINFVDGNIINPRLLSDNVEVHPLLVIAALIGGGAIGGFLGMIIAVPCAALVKLYFDKFLKMKEEERNEELLAESEAETAAKKPPAAKAKTTAKKPPATKKRTTAKKAPAAKKK